jgi:hypothetical protein
MSTPAAPSWPDDLVSGTVPAQLDDASFPDYPERQKDTNWVLFSTTLIRPKIASKTLRSLPRLPKVTWRAGRWTPPNPSKRPWEPVATGVRRVKMGRMGRVGIIFHSWRPRGFSIGVGRNRPDSGFLASVLTALASLQRRSDGRGWPGPRFCHQNCDWSEPGPFPGIRANGSANCH